jgi:hypothetical protein
MNTENTVLKYIEGIHSELKTYSDARTNLNPSDLEKREQYISALEKYYDKINSLAHEINNKISCLKKIQTDEINELDNILSKLKNKNGTSSNEFNRLRISNGARAITKNNSETWLEIAGRSTDNNREVVQISRMMPPPGFVTYSKIRINDYIYIEAKKVNDFSSVLSSGELYYVESADHFAIKIMEILIHGHIGLIYTNSDNPVKIKECKYRENCKKDNCEFYHNPLVVKGSKDHRNFIASSWLYSPPTAISNKYNIKSRRFGSKEYIDTDLNIISDEEVERFYDQTMHDILCTIILKKYYKYKGDFS